MIAHATMTAVITPGIKTQRVHRVGPASSAASAFINAANPAPVEIVEAPVEIVEDPVRPRRHSAVGYTVVSVSFYDRDLDELDDMVERLRAAGIGKASRSWLLRIAIRKLDLPAVIAEELMRR